MKIIVGTRKSQLALKQAEEVISLLKAIDPTLLFEIRGFDTTGDLDKKTSIAQVEGSDFFTREIDQALLKGEIDMAVHSAKDLPDQIPEGLKIAAITKGLDSCDVLVSKYTFKRLPKNAKIGTSSQRRKEQIKQLCPDLELIDIRGTIEERLNILDSGKVDALILAAAGLLRLGLKSRIKEYLAFETAPGQGKLGIGIRIRDRDKNEELEKILNKIDYRRKLGKVYIVGAGPGDPELITVKGKKVLDNADVIVYDGLINCFAIARNDKKKIYVGKKKGKHSRSQEEINQLLVKLSNEGKNVVRLKGGDPFIFGRGGEEIEYLKKHFIPYEIIPGISAAQAASAYSEIPLTQRGISPSVVFYKGHPEDEIQVSKPNYGTMVYYMAASTLKTVAQKAIEKGWNKNTPAAIIQNASWLNQKVTITNLEKLTQDENEFESPLILIIGEVVKGKSPKNWFSEKKKILVTGTNPDKYKNLGEVIHQPLIELVPLDNYSTVDKKLKNLKKYSMLIFTSKHAVYFFLQRLKAIEKDSRSLSKLKVCSIGEATTEELNKYGIQPDFQPEIESSQGLLQLFKKKNIKNEKILIPRSNLAKEGLPKGLKKCGNTVETLIIYKNHCPKNIKKINLSLIDIIVFSSQSAIVNFKKIYGEIPKQIEVIRP